MGRLAIGLALAVFNIWTFNAGLELGLRNKPVFDASKYQEVGCSEITAFEYGVKCTIFMQEEDDNVRIFRGEGSLDDTDTSSSVKRK